ncbi:tryptophan synthase subunit alpha [Streptomyces sp. NPDC053474]|uniref:tryptophan synthase subunit alpha n=1 Tax=Streptomyces sp. NPDC053474 TaxID=3365704 RepID=UPI0037D7E2F4
MSAARLTLSPIHLTPAAAWLTERLTHHAPQLGVFLPVGIAGPGGDATVLRLLADRGADILEVGIPHHDPIYDGPLITHAYRQALYRGIGVAEALDTVHRTASATAASLVVMTYWEPVRAWGPDRFARDLAAAGAAGAMIVDLPVSQAGPWLTAARRSGIHTPQLAARHSSDAEIRQIAAAATGWVYAPAAHALTGYTGRLDLPSLTAFTQRLHAAGPTPVVTGIGVSTPAKAAQVRHLVSAVVVGTPVIRPLLELGASDGLRAAADRVAAFAQALRPAAQTMSNPPMNSRGLPRRHRNRGHPWDT